MPLEGEQLSSTGGLPDDGRPIGASAGHNPSAIGRIAANGGPLQLKGHQVEVTLPLPVIPLEPAILRVPGLGEQLLQSADVVLFPGLLGQIHVGHIEMAAGFRLTLLGSRSFLVCFVSLPGAHDRSGEQRHRHRRSGGERQLVAPERFPQSVERRGRAGHDWFIIQVALDVGGKSFGRLVAAGAVFFQALHHDPVEVAFELVAEPFRIGVVGRGEPGAFAFLAERFAQAHARSRRFDFADDAPHFLVAGVVQGLRVEGGAPGQQFVEHHPKAVDVRARVDAHPARAASCRLLRGHVDRGAEELLDAGEKRLAGGILLDGLGDAEVDDLRHGLSVALGHEDVRGLEVAVDDALLVGVIDGGADVAEQFEALAGVEIVLIAVVGDGDAVDQLHGEVGPPGGGGPGVEHVGDIRVVHHREGLALGLEAGQHLPRVHPGLDHFERDLACDRPALFGHPDHPEPALADLLHQRVGAEDVARVFGDRIDGLFLARRLRLLLRELEKVRRWFPGAQERLDLLARLRIVAAGRGEKTRAFLRRGQGQGLAEEFYDAIGVGFHFISSWFCRQKCLPTMSSEISPPKLLRNFCRRRIFFLASGLSSLPSEWNPPFQNT